MYGLILCWVVVLCRLRMLWDGNIWALYAKRVNVCPVLRLAVNRIETLLYIFRAVWFNSLLHSICYAVLFVACENMLFDGYFMFDPVRRFSAITMYASYVCKPTRYELTTRAMFNTKFHNLFLDPL